MKKHIKLIILLVILTITLAIIGLVTNLNTITKHINKEKTSAMQSQTTADELAQAAEPNPAPQSAEAEVQTTSRHHQLGPNQSKHRLRQNWNPSSRTKRLHSLKRRKWNVRQRPKHNQNRHQNRTRANLSRRLSMDAKRRRSMGQRKQRRSKHNQYTNLQRIHSRWKRRTPNNKLDCIQPLPIRIPIRSSNKRKHRWANKKFKHRKHQIRNSVRKPNIYNLWPRTISRNI